MNKKRAASKPKAGKKSSNTKLPVQEGNMTTRRTRSQQKVKDSEKIEPTGETDVNISLNINLVNEPKINRKQKQVANKRTRSTRQEQISETDQLVKITEKNMTDSAKPPKKRAKTTKNKTSEGVDLVQPSNAGDVSPDDGKKAIGEDSKAKGKAKKRKPNKKAQIPQTSSSSDVSPDDNFEVVKPKIRKASQTKATRKSKAPPQKKEKATKPPPRSILQLRIVLHDVYPPVWRRIQVLNNDTFFNLHEHIKEAMGWMSPAGHQFIVPKPKKKMNVLIVNGFLDDLLYDFTRPNLLKGQTTKLSKFLNAKDDHVFYQFDFGESWCHDVIVERVLPPPGPKAEYPKCTGGKRASPPAECGGVDGYNHLMEVYNDPNHSEYDELILEWLADQEPGWDPERFDKKEIFRRVRMWVYVGP